MLIFLAYEDIWKIKKHWHDGELHKQLCKRKKCQHLVLTHKNYIWQIMSSFLKDHKSIKAAYKLSSATYDKLNKMKDSVNHGMDLNIQANLIRSSISMNAHKIIIDVIKPPWAPTTIWRIGEDIFNDLGERNSSYTSKLTWRKFWSITQEELIEIAQILPTKHQDW